MEASDREQHLAERVAHLELLFMDLQRTLESLHEVALQQQQRLDLLDRAFAKLRMQWAAAAERSDDADSIES